MRRLISVLGVMAMVGLMSGTASAQFEYGMNYFQFDNWDNGNGDGSGPAFQPGGWNATTDGAIWISTGGSTPVLNTQDLNFQLDYRSTPTSPWIAITGAYLLSNGVAKLDVTVGSGGYPGYWMGATTRPAGETITSTHLAVPDGGQRQRNVLPAGNLKLELPRRPADPGGDAVQSVRLDRRLQQLRCGRRRRRGGWRHRPIPSRPDRLLDHADTADHFKQHAVPCAHDARRRQLRRQSRYQRPDRRVGPLQPDAA